MHPAIKLRHIRGFLAIAADGNLTAAARRQGITQPALSRSLAELETLLGAPLFHRQGRRLVLTEAGALFRRQASLGLRHLEAGAAELLPDAREGRIRAGILPTVATRFFPAVALRFRELAPAMVLSVETGPHPYLLRQLREGALDLVLGRMPAAAEMADLSFTHLYEDEIVLAARAGHPAAGLTAPEALTRAPVIVPPEGAVIRHVVDDYLASLGLSALRPAFETVAPAMGRALVLRSDALWFISRGVIADDLDSRAMVALPGGARFLSGSVGMTLRQPAAGLPGLELLVQTTRDMARAGQG